MNTNRVEIILAEPAQTDAFNALRKRNNELLRSEFVGPVFLDADVSVGGGFVVVTPKDMTGIRYMYPAHTVARVKEVPCAAT